MNYNEAFLRLVRTCGENELGCSNSGSGVSDVQADELIKSFTSKSKIINEQNIIKTQKRFRLLRKYKRKRNAYILLANAKVWSRFRK